MSSSPAQRLVDYLNHAEPTYVARDGVVCMVDSQRPEADASRYTPSSTCVPFRPTMADAQRSAEDVAFMMDGYCRALLLLGRIMEGGLTPDLYREAGEFLREDEEHMSRRSPDGTTRDPPRSVPVAVRR